jgi:hypothetical protein
MHWSAVISLGLNAIFLRKNLCGAYFAQPFTGENHYEPPR